jgi:hypothetical protein
MYADHRNTIDNLEGVLTSARVVFLGRMISIAQRFEGGNGIKLGILQLRGILNERERL